MNKKFISILFFMLLFIPTTSLAFTNENTPPNPPIIEGPTSGKVREFYEYDVTLTDPDEDDFMFELEIDFGDELIVEGGAGCAKTWYNGTVLSFSHRWNKPGDYEIRARAKDSFDEWSEWSEPLQISMPKAKFYPKIMNIIFERFPMLENLFF